MFIWGYILYNNTIMNYFVELSRNYHQSIAHVYTYFVAFKLLEYTSLIVNNGSLNCHKNALIVMVKFAVYKFP